MTKRVMTAVVAAGAMLTLASAAPGVQAQGRAALTSDAAVYCAASYSGEAVYASGARKAELVEWTGLAFRRADDLARTQGLPPTRVYEDFNAAGIKLRREPKAAVQELQARCLLTAAAPITPMKSAALSPTCRSINSILTAAKEPTAFKSISLPAKGGFTPGKLVPPGLQSCSVYPGIKSYSCAILDQTPKAGWELFYRLRGEVETCTGKPALYDFTRSGKGSIARLGAGEKPRVSIAVTELDGKAMISLTVDGE